MSPNVLSSVLPRAGRGKFQGRRCLRSYLRIVWILAAPDGQAFSV